MAGVINSRVIGQRKTHQLNPKYETRLEPVDNSGGFRRVIVSQTMVQSDYLSEEHKIVNMGIQPLPTPEAIAELDLYDALAVELGLTVEEITAMAKDGTLWDHFADDEPDEQPAVDSKAMTGPPENKALSGPPMNKEIKTARETKSDAQPNRG